MLNKILTIVCGIVFLLCTITACGQSARDTELKPTNDNSSTLETSGQSEIPDEFKVPQDYEPTYTTAVVGYSDGLVYIPGLKQEYDFRDTEAYKDHVPVQTVVFTINGNELNGSSPKLADRTYNGAGYGGFYPIYDYYSDEADMEVDVFGNLVRYSLHSDCPPLSKELTQDECEQVASQFFKDVVGDQFSSYQVTNYAYVDWGNMYSVEFTKFVDGIATTDIARFAIDKTCKVHDYVSYMLGTIASDAKNPFDMEKAKNDAHAALEKYVEKMRENYDRIEYGEESFALTKLKDGSLGIIYTIEVDGVTVYPESNEIGYQGQLFEFLIR